jgi:hypothetical protein
MKNSELQASVTEHLLLHQQLKKQQETLKEKTADVMITGF